MKPTRLEYINVLECYMKALHYFFKGYIYLVSSKNSLPLVMSYKCISRKTRHQLSQQFKDFGKTMWHMTKKNKDKFHIEKYLNLLFKNIFLSSARPSLHVRWPRRSLWPCVASWSGWTLSISSRKKIASSSSSINSLEMKNWRCWQQSAYNSLCTER